MGNNNENVFDSQAAQPAEPNNPFKAIKGVIVNDEHDKDNDDEMARPEEDRSPLT